VLLYDGEICDARYSKSCGGVTEVYSAAWEDIAVPYLVSVYDGAGELSGYGLPLSREENARAWITSLPPAYCNTRSEELLARILPGFDQETRDFYRWEVLYDQDELREILLARLGEDLGAVRSLEAVERGRSGRIIRLLITGENGSLVIGKELEVRRALSRTHLYSSALVARPVINDSEKYPSAFRLIGAGWGHGVGLCQIGAAVMADTGMGHEQILAHYFRGTKLRAIY
jgi:peptidoglycan hydrolase-like amidase